MRAFADQRRKLKPNRKHETSRNPLKVLQTRDDVKDDFEDFSSEDEEELQNGHNKQVSSSM